MDRAENLQYHGKNLVYNGGVSYDADLEWGATLKQLGKNFDQGTNYVGSENIIPAGYSSVTDKLCCDAYIVSELRDPTQ